MAGKISFSSSIKQIPNIGQVGSDLAQRGSVPHGRAWLTKAPKLSDYSDFNADHE